MTEENEVWLSMGEAARQFGVSPKTLRRLLKEQQVPVLHLSGNIRVRQGDLDRLKADRIRPMGAVQ